MYDKLFKNFTKMSSVMNYVAVDVGKLQQHNASVISNNCCYTPAVSRHSYAFIVFNKKGCLDYGLFKKQVRFSRLTKWE